MSFIYPYFLFGVSAVSIPIIIHLFNLQKTKRVYFSNIAFLRNVQNLSKKSIKVKNLYILLSRILFIVFLVLAFAQPFLPSSNKMANADFINIYVDNSLSTQSSVGNDRVLDVSIKNIQSFGTVLPSNALVNISSNDFNNYTNQIIDKSKITDVVGNLQFSSKSKTLSEALDKKVRRYSELEGRKRASYVFSDFQKSFLDKPGNLKLDSSVNYFFVPVTPENASNVFVDSVWLESPFVNLNENNILKARAVNSGEEQKQNVILKLTIEGRQVATSSINLPPNSNQIVDFNFNLTKGGIKKGVISINDYPVVFDNDYYFSFKTASKIKVLEITSAVAGSPYLEKVFLNKELFEHSQKKVENLDFNSLSSYDFIVLNNISSFSEGFNQAVARAIQNNSSILIVPTEKPEFESYNKLLNQFSIFINKTTVDSVQEELNQPNLSDPFYHGIFENQKERMFLPKERAFISWNKIGVNHLTFKNQMPFLTQVNTGKGKIYLLSSNLSSNSGLALNALFVPIIYKMAISSLSNSERLAYDMDDKLITLPIKATAKNAVFKLVKDKAEIIPGQRIMSSGLVMEIPETNLTPGHYMLMLKDSVVSDIAFNYSSKESIMDFYKAEELKELFRKQKNVDILEGAAKNDLTEEIKEANNGLPLWKICIIISLFFLFIEILLLRFYKVQEVGTV
jgi:hypothetical protein